MTKNWPAGLNTAPHREPRLDWDRCARAHAWLLGRDFVSPDDVKAMAYDVLRHRLVVSYDGEIAGVTADDVIDRLLDLVPVA